MEYHVLPEFLRQREQRVGGLLTPFQILAALGGLLPLLLVAQASWLCVPPMLVLVGLAVVAMHPAEGALRGLLWLFRLRALVGREIDEPAPFVAGDAVPDEVPVVLYDGQGEVMLSASLALEEGS